jgi:folate-dependent phosphoribosylglycinamide formyltransferase PurN
MREEQFADVRYFTPSDLHFAPPQERLRVALITSVRDLVAERVGQHVPSPDGAGLYVKGTLERAIDELRGGYLARYVQLVAIITDDLEKDLHPKGYPLMPTKGQPWIHPLSLRIDGRTLARDLYWHIPSRHRLLKLSDRERRAEQKYEFENKVRSILLSTDADVLLSDHFIGRIEYLIREDCHRLFGRVLNTHPGITHAAHPFKTRGLTPYQDAIAHARGYRVNPGTGACEPLAAPHGRAGSSFHVIDRDFDTGPVLCDTEATPVHPDDEWLTLAARNYHRSKPLAFRHGLMHYTAHVWPHLSSIDWGQLREIHREEPLAS